jgi:hypothetical protein
MSTLILFRKTLIFILAATVSACSSMIADLKAEPTHFNYRIAKTNFIWHELETTQSDTLFTYQIIEAPNKKFGYDIYKNKQMLIHQPSIPAFPGNEGFQTKADAVKIAMLVIKKLKRGEMPPSVSRNELIALKVKIESTPNN